MPNYSGDGTDSGYGGAFTSLSSTMQDSSVDGSFDWLNQAISGIGGTAVNVLNAKNTIDAISKQSKTQKAYENANQTASRPIGDKNLISGIDNNIILVGAVVAVGFLMFVKD